MSLIRFTALFLFLFSYSSLTTAAGEHENWTPRDNDLRILEIRVKQYILDDILAAYQYQNTLLVPIGALADMLDLAVNVNPGNGIAQGFLFKENNTIFLDTSRNEVIIRGETQPYNKMLVFVLDDDIYVDANLLSRWFDIKMDTDLFSSTVYITSDNPFPFIVRMEREARISKTRARLATEQPYYPHHYEPYDMWNVPFIDQTFDATRRQGDGESTNTFRSTTYATADLLGMESSLYLLATDDDITDEFRFTIGKKDPDSELLGFARATEYALGSIREPRLKNLTIPGKQQPGGLVSNFTLGRQAEYDRQRFTGNLLPGWEVELYQNDRLIGYQSEPVDGQYDFVDIPLLYGKNYFRLVFYGPQGQVREQEEFFEVGQSLTKNGEHFYRALASDNENGGSRATLQYDVGLTDRLSASFVGASIPLDVNETTVEQHNYAQAGLRAFWESFFVTIDLIDDIDGGEAVDFDVQTGIGKTSIKLNHTIMNHFFSEEYRLSQQEFKDKTEFRIDTSCLLYTSDAADDN
mgnify:FL=1